MTLDITATIGWTKSTHDYPAMLRGYTPEAEQVTKTVVFELPDDLVDMVRGKPDWFLELLFEQTNLYQGPLWEQLQPLPDDRDHTALSVGDTITLDGVMFECKSRGWDVVRTKSKR